MVGYNKYVGDRMLPEKGKDAEKEGGHAGGPLFLFPALKSSFSIKSLLKTLMKILFKDM